MRNGQDPNDRASGTLCRQHFQSRTATVAQVYYCPQCQTARETARERIQRENTINPEQPYGTHVQLTCQRHPSLRWSTKNIDYIGARSIFYLTQNTPECECPVYELIALK